MRTVVFDLDGTLADTSADLIAAANACLRGHGLSDLLDPATDMLTAFLGGRAMLRLGYSRAGLRADEVLSRADQEYSTLLTHYERNLAVHTKLYPGVTAAVTTLRDRGFRTAICTNKPEHHARLLVTALGVMPLFDALIGADTLPVRKPDPAPFRAAVLQAGGDVRRSMLIGDTKTDRDTARNADVPSVLVTFGPEGDAIAALDPAALLGRYADLPDLAETLLPA